MAKDRLAPCESYISKDNCAKGVTGGADMKGKCKTCKKYRPRKGFKAVDKKRESREKSNKNFKSEQY